MNTYENIMDALGKTAELTRANSENTAIVLAKLNAQEILINGLSNTVSGISESMTGLSDDINQLKLNEEVTTTQQEIIVESAQKRVVEIIGDNPLEREKYFKIFIQRLYKDTRQSAGLGSKIARTRKGDYQRCIDYIEAWIPSCGCAELRAKADAYAKARLEAKKLGYRNQAGDNLPNYVKIPREIIYNKELGDKRVIIFSYLCSRRALDDTVAFSISELCHWSHLKPNYHDGKINHKYLKILELLSHYGYFESYPNFEKLAKEKKNYTDYYNIKINTEKFDIPDNFGIIYFDELVKILNFKEELKGVKVNDEEIDLLRMSSAYLLLLLSYLRVNMNRNTDKPLCCYRLYQKITEDIGLSERYITRIVEILDVMNIVKFQEGKRIRYKKEENKYGFLTTPKVFADYRRFVKDEKGNQNIDNSYDYKAEIQNQLVILEESQKKIQKHISQP